MERLSGKFLDIFPGLVVVDEAYIDFSPEGSLVGELDKYPQAGRVANVLQSLGIWPLSGWAWRTPRKRSSVF